MPKPDTAQGNEQSVIAYQTDVAVPGTSEICDRALTALLAARRPEPDAADHEYFVSSRGDVTEIVCRVTGVYSDAGAAALAALEVARRVLDGAALIPADALRVLAIRADVPRHGAGSPRIASRE